MTAPAESDGFVFEIPQEENPITYGATALRDLTSDLVTKDLKDIFPRNNAWSVGDYDLIFHPMESLGGNTVRMIVLTPQGIIKTGIVKESISSDHTAWEFDDADLQPATDIQVVRFAPVLIRGLIDQVGEEVQEFADLPSIKRSLEFLFDRDEILEKADNISRVSLEEMGDEVVLEEEETEDEQDKRLGTLERLQAAVELYENRSVLAAEVKELAKMGRVRAIEQKVADIFGEIKGNGLLPEPDLTLGGEHWFSIPIPVANRPISHTIGGNLHVYDMDRESRQTQRREIILSVDGAKIMEEIRWKNIPPVRCAEHILSEADAVVTGLVVKSVAQYFPNLIWQ